MYIISQIIISTLMFLRSSGDSETGSLDLSVAPLEPLQNHFLLQYKEGLNLTGAITTNLTTNAVPSDRAPRVLLDVIAEEEEDDLLDRIVSHEKDDFSRSDAFHPEKHFTTDDSQRYNVSGQDIYGLHQSLIDPHHGFLDYHKLRACPHGRHLMLISLLENLRGNYWEPRAQGLISYYLPPSLRSENQPIPPKGSFLLKEIRMRGRLITRGQLIFTFLRRKASSLQMHEQMSRFKTSHVMAVQSLINFVLSQETFDSMLTLLVAIKEFCHERMYIETVLTVITVRDDCGYILPSIMTVIPHDYFPLQLINNEHNELQSSGHRQKRQTGRFNSYNSIRIRWDKYPYKTLPDSDPESKLWYFREDPGVNAGHHHWHTALSNNKVSTWSPLHSSNINRRGEVFYFTHKQMLTRYNVERLCNDLPLVTSFDSSEWNQPQTTGYDSKLYLATGVTANMRGAERAYPPRHPGAQLNSFHVRRLQQDDTNVRAAIANKYIFFRNRGYRLEYRDGIDHGISPLGDIVEAITSTTTYGDLHNNGHSYIALMHQRGDTSMGVMANAATALRDPIFYRWHKFIDDLFREYKSSLPAYGDEDLDFAGVEVVTLTVQSDRPKEGPVNVLYTYSDYTTVSIGGIDYRNQMDRREIEYTRLNNVPFNLELEVTSASSTQGLVRCFLIPANIWLPSHTDITQVTIEIDRFFVQLQPGTNKINRHSRSSPFLSKSGFSLYDLQSQLLQGRISQEEFNWAGCGWPQEMALPRGKEEGMTFRLFVMISKLLPNDRAATSNWEKLGQTAWSWCGVSRRDGDVPDSRPMGFPLDRAPPDGMWQSLMTRADGTKRNNFAATDITIRYDPVGTT